MPRLKALWRNLVRRKRAERDLDEELAACAVMLADEDAEYGVAGPEARRRALVALGGVEQLKEQVRGQRAGHTFESLFRDIAQSGRSLRRSKGVTLLAIATLGIGLGAATLIFSIFDAALLARLPFREPERLVELWETRAGAGWDQSSFSRPNFRDMQDRNTTFESMAAMLGTDMNLTGSGEPAHVNIAMISARFFHVLGVTPAAGRNFDPDADAPGRDDAVALLSNTFWQTHFGASRSAIGATIHLDDRSYTVIGAMPAGEPFLDAADIFIPMRRDPTLNRGNFEVRTIGRLKPGVSIAVATADLQRIAAGLAANYREDRGMGVRIAPSSTWGASPVIRRALEALLAATGLLLAIACVNVANLLLARASARTRELKVRQALGASRWRIARLVFTESAIVGLAGAGAGLLIAQFGLRLVRAANINGVPRISETAINGPVLGFALAAAILAAILSGMAPALESSRHSDIAGALREGDRSQTAGRRRSRLRALLVAVEVSLSMVLLVGAGLLIRSFGKLLDVPRGFETTGRVIASVNIPNSRDNARAAAITTELLRGIQALPGVTAAGTVNSRPITGWDPGMGFGGRDAAPQSDVPWASWRYVSDGYFRAMGIPLQQGRGFTGADFYPAPGRRSVIVSRAVADLLWPDRNPIGRHIVLWKGQGNRDAEVVGVVANTRDHGLDADPTKVVYLPFIGQTYSPVQVVIDGPMTAGRASLALRRLLAGIDASIPVSQVETMEDLVSRSVGSRKWNAALVAVFAAVALLLSMSGIYGVLAYAVARRSSEIGIRLALGADGGGIFRLIVSEGMRPVLAGIAIGAAGSIAAARMIGSLLFGVQPLDIESYALVIALILATSLISCVLPARRALSLDPAAALREG